MDEFPFEDIIVPSRNMYTDCGCVLQVKSKSLAYISDGVSLHHSSTGLEYTYLKVSMQTGNSDA
jgi:hypothetical protein